MAYPDETPIPFMTFSFLIFSDRGFSSPKLFFIKSINFSKSCSALLPIHCTLISVPFDAARVINPNNEEPLTVFFPFLTTNFDSHFDVKLTNLAAALACRPSLFVIRIFFSNLFSCNFFYPQKKQRQRLYIFYLLLVTF